VNLGPGFQRLAWSGIVTVDCLQRLLWRSRPYEKEPGSADGLFAEYKQKLLDCIIGKGHARDLLKQAAARFRALVDPSLPRKPLVGINGEVYLRNNRFSNKDLVRACEAAGLEVVVSPLGEWLKYIYHRNIEDAASSRSLKRVLAGYIKKLVLEHDEHLVTSQCRGLLDVNEPPTTDILSRTSLYLSPRCGSEAVLSLGSGLIWMQDPRFAGAISVMPHGCMPGGIVAAMSERLSTTYQKPWISLTYDGFPETNNLTRINNFAEVIRFCSQEKGMPGSMSD
jgi:predicted nucleotide-binding protein (sugar kinase/HSP70/actin superfamily)